MSMEERIEFDNPKMMDEAIYKARICYQQSKQKGDVLGKRWDEKKGSKSAGSIKGNRSGGSKGLIKGQISKNSQKNSFRS